MPASTAMALSRPDRSNLDRSSHRQDHLDDIEQALAQAGECVRLAAPT